MMSESFDAIITPVNFLSVETVSVKGPRCKQLNAFCGHFNYEFVGQVASCDARVVVNSEDVHEVVLNRYVQYRVESRK
jgi:hypothetical protein